MMATAFFPSASEASNRPNILFVLADDWGCGDAGAYGRTWIRTPAFDRVAHEGLLFENAFTPNAKCAPSRACLLTGRNSCQLKEAGNHGGFFPLEVTTYPEALEKNGYFVGMTSKGWAPGVALDPAGNPAHPTAGVLIGVEKTQPKGAQYPTYRLLLGRQPAPADEAIAKMDEEEVSAPVPLEDTIRVLKPEEEWQCLSKVMAPATVEEIRATL
jgi:hypothetical protein